jgi:multidrug efflux pump subunit AcrA (membrane-fusion protein)
MLSAFYSLFMEFCRKGPYFVYMRECGRRDKRPAVFAVTPFGGAPLLAAYIFYGGFIMAQKISFKKAALFFITLAAMAGMICAPSILADNAGASLQGEKEKAAPVFSVRTAQAERRTLETYLEVNGNIVSERQVTVFPDIAGKLSSVKVELGSAVRKGDLLAEVDASRPGTVYSLSPVYAPLSGTVTTVPLAVGATVAASSGLFVISGNGALELEAQIPERELAQLKTGLKAAVSLEAFPGEIFSATLTRLSPVVDPGSRSKKIVLRFDRDDPRINAGMFARIKLSTRSFADVVSVPSAALVESRGKPGVYVPDLLSGEVLFREIESGVTVDGETEIRSGLAVGETVVIQGQQFLSDGAKVRIIAAIPRV